MKNFARTGLSGLIGVALMDLLVNFPGYYLFESKQTVRKEKSVHVYGRWAPEAAATLIASKFFPAFLSNKQSLFFGRILHFGLGAVAAFLYLPLLRRSALLKDSGGLHLCALMFVFDEIMTHKLGFTAKPSKYPWQAHVRGALSNTVLGIVIHQSLKKQIHYA